MSIASAEFDPRLLQNIFAYELYNIHKEEKEDLRQECYQKIIDALKKNPNVPADKFVSFSQKIIKCTKVDAYRKRARKITQSSVLVCFNDGTSDEFKEQANLDDDRDRFSFEVTDFGYGLAEVRADFYHNRHVFTPQEQKAITCWLENDGIGMTLVEVSELAGVHKSHVTRAVKKLKEICA